MVTLFSRTNGILFNLDTIKKIDIYYDYLVVPTKCNTIYTVRAWYNYGENNYIDISKNYSNKDEALIFFNCIFDKIQNHVYQTVSPTGIVINNDLYIDLDKIEEQVQIELNNTKLN